MTVAQRPLEITANFDSGNIEVLDLSNPLQPLLAIKPDTRSPHFQWFHFKASGLHVGQDHWFRLSNASKSWSSSDRGCSGLSSSHSTSATMSWSR